jgi:hypothetical protein
MRPITMGAEGFRMRFAFILLALAGLGFSRGMSEDAWSPVPTPPNGGVIRSMAAESGYLAIATQNGIFLTANQGLQWQGPFPNRYIESKQRLHLSKANLFVSSPESRRLYRYSLARAEWDSLLLPEYDLKGPSPWGEEEPLGYVFAADGDRVGFGAVAAGRTRLFLSSDEGTHFEARDTLPFPTYLRFNAGMALSGDTVTVAARPTAAIPGNRFGVAAGDMEGLPPA